MEMNGLSAALGLVMDIDPALGYVQPHWRAGSDAFVGVTLGLCLQIVQGVTLKNTHVLNIYTGLGNCYIVHWYLDLG